MKNFSEKKIKEYETLEIMKLKCKFYDEYLKDEETSFVEYEDQITAIENFVKSILEGE